MTMFGKANQTFEVWSDNRAQTCKAVGAITGKRFVKIVAGGSLQVPNVAVCGAGEQPYGVAGWDAADGETLSVKQIGTYTVTAGAALTAPAQVQSDATGRAIPLAAGIRAGSVYHDAALNADAAVRLAAL